MSAAAGSSAGRSVGQVIDNVIAKVPRDNRYDHLVARLTRARLDSWFQPPESSKPWLDLRNILEEEIGEPSAPWHFEVVKEVQGS